MKPSAKIILDSISPDGVRLTTMEVVMHRFVLAEFNTHRVFSRNSASSRAIKISTMHERVLNNPAIPVSFGINRPGMQATEELTGTQLEEAIAQWLDARNEALKAAYSMKNYNIHKQISNRVLEPFMWHTVIVTATEWDNFFWQRCSPLAQPEMKAAADEMQRAYYTSEPKLMPYGKWHLPYIYDEDYESVDKLYDNFYQEKFEYFKDRPDGLVDIETRYLHLRQDWIKSISVARCARVSVLNHDGKRDIKKDLELYEKLRNAMPIHISPFEHVATPIDKKEIELWIRQVPLLTLIKDEEYSDEVISAAIKSTFIGNFRGWKQYRKQIPKENLTNFIPNLPDLALERLQKKMEEKNEHNS